MNEQYINSRLTDALALCKELLALPNLVEDRVSMAQRETTLYGTLNVLFTVQDGYLEILAYDTRNPDALLVFEGMADFLAFVLRRWW